MNAPFFPAVHDLALPGHDWTLAEVEALFEDLFADLSATAPQALTIRAGRAAAL